MSLKNLLLEAGPHSINVTTCSANELFELAEFEFEIPPYQRNYVWSEQTVCQLLSDVNAFAEGLKVNPDNMPQNEKIDTEKHENMYRLGTLMLCKEDNKKEDNKKEDNKKFKIVDGQQRLITLAIIRSVLQHEYPKSFRDVGQITIDVPKQQDREIIERNVRAVQKWISLRKPLMKSQNNCESRLIYAFKNCIGFAVVIFGEKYPDTRLFETQNNRGKTPEQHDILKAYHLMVFSENKKNLRCCTDPLFTKTQSGENREQCCDSILKNDSCSTSLTESEKEKLYEELFKEWKYENNDLKRLFEEYLYKSIKWSQGERCGKHPDIIKMFEGISPTNRAFNFALACPSKTDLPFLIGAPFLAGEDFFRLTNFHLKKMRHLEKAFVFYCKHHWVNKKDGSKSAEYNDSRYKYTKTLFLISAFYFLNRFGEKRERDSIKIFLRKLFIWSHMIRLGMTRIGEATIDKYAVGEKEKGYPYSYQILRLINNSQSPEEAIFNLNLSISMDKYRNKDANKETDKLLEEILQKGLILLG